MFNRFGLFEKEHKRVCLPKAPSDLFVYIPFNFISLYLLVFMMLIIKSLKYFGISRPMKVDARFQYAPWKIVWFCFISIVWIYLSHKTEIFRFWRSLKYFNIILTKKDMMSDLNMSHEKMTGFFFISIVWVCFSHKTDKIWFWRSLKCSDIF